MKIQYRIVLIVFAIAGMFFSRACTEETAETDHAAKEQRYLELYMASNYPEAEPQENGFYFIEETPGEGDSPDSADWVLMNHVSYTLPDDDVYESYIENVVVDNNLDPNQVGMYGPYKMLTGSRNFGLTEGLSLMKNGGEATVVFHSDMGYGSSGYGSITGYTSLKYEIELLEVITDMNAYELAKIDSYIDTIAVYDTIHDPITDAIMYYIIDFATDGAPVAIDSTIQVGYKGYLTDERVFDESVEGAPYEFKVGDYAAETSPIPGWHLGLERFKKGEKGRLIIPYQLAYGEEEKVSGGVRTLPPYETLVFDVEIISVVGSGDDGDDIGEQK